MRAPGPRLPVVVAVAVTAILAASLIGGSVLGSRPGPLVTIAWAAVVLCWALSWMRISAHCDRVTAENARLAAELAERGPAWHRGGDGEHMEARATIVAVQTAGREAEPLALLFHHGVHCPGHLPGCVPNAAECTIMNGFTGTVDLQPDGEIVFMADWLGGRHPLNPG